MKKLGHGVFTWSPFERRSNRYGSFNLVSETFGGEVCTTPTFDKKLGDSLRGEKVKITAKVLKARKSGHIGDIFLGIYPSKPKVGEEIELGVGILSFEPCEYDEKVTTIILGQGDRDELWMDPRKLYRLHDQTVDIFVEKTKAKCSKAPDLLVKEEDGIISLGAGDLQIKSKEISPSDKLKIKPKAERFGGGLIVLSHDHEAGERLEFEVEKEKK